MYSALCDSESVFYFVHVICLSLLVLSLHCTLVFFPRLSLSVCVSVTRVSAFSACIRD